MKFNWPLYSDIIFLTMTVRGVSKKHCLLLFSIGIYSLRNMPMHYSSVLKAVKMIFC